MVKKQISAIAISSLLLLAGCSDKSEETPAATQQQAAPTAQAPTAPTAPAATPAPTNQSQGKVTKVTHAAGYTYLEVDMSGQKLWVASSPVNVKTGDTIAWSGGAMMQNFTSKSLRRTFERIIFVNTVTIVN